MEILQSLPWWGATYLGLVTAVSAGGFWSVVQEDRAMAFSGLFSTLCIFIFVIGYYYPPLAQYFSWFLLPMVGIGLLWEFKKSVIETGLAQKELENEIDLTDGEKDFLVNVAIILNATLVIPGYVCGIILCFDLLNSVFV